MPRLALLLIAPALLLAACGNDDAPSSSPATTTAPALTADVDWEARTIAWTGDAGFTIEFCAGEAPLLCVASADGHLGAIEHLRIPGATQTDSWVWDYYESVALDRTTSCDPDYRLERLDPTPADVAGGTGMHYGYSATIDGTLVEQLDAYAVVADGGMELLVASGLADDGCLARESEMPVDLLEELSPALAAIAAGSSF